MDLSTIDFAKVNRNDPCPCGSGKKFKKCHYRTQSNLAQTQENTVSLSKFIKKGQTPYLWFKGLKTIINRRDWGVMYDVFQAESPVLETFPSKDAFVEQARNSPSGVPCGGDYELRRFRILGEQVFMMGVRGKENRRASKHTFEVMALVNTEEGYRVTHFETVEVPKAESGEDPAFESFACVEAAYTAALAEPVVRPEVNRWPLPGEEPAEEVVDPANAVEAAPDVVLGTTAAAAETTEEAPAGE